MRSTAKRISKKSNGSVHASRANKNRRASSSLLILRANSQRATRVGSPRRSASETAYSGGTLAALHNGCILLTIPIPFSSLVPHLIWVHVNKHVLHTSEFLTQDAPDFRGNLVTCEHGDVPIHRNLDINNHVLAVIAHAQFINGPYPVYLHHLFTVRM